MLPVVITTSYYCSEQVLASILVYAYCRHSHLKLIECANQRLLSRSEPEQVRARSTNENEQGCMRTVVKRKGWHNKNRRSAIKSRGCTNPFEEQSWASRGCWCRRWRRGSPPECCTSASPQFDACTFWPGHRSRPAKQGSCSRCSRCRCYPPAAWNRRACWRSVAKTAISCTETVESTWCAKPTPVTRRSLLRPGRNSPGLCRQGRCNPSSGLGKGQRAAAACVNIVFVVIKGFMNWEGAWSSGSAIWDGRGFISCKTCCWLGDVEIGLYFLNNCCFLDQIDLSNI